MYFDRFDVCEAYYLFLSHYHDGQWGKMYRRLCHLLTYFKPSPMLSVDSLSENGAEIYRMLAEKAETNNGKA